MNLGRILKGKLAPSESSRRFREYQEHYRDAKDGGLETGNADYKAFTNTYYDLVTDFYEYGWGRSFHFASRVPGESFRESLIRHEHRIADALGLKPGMVAADLGCGIGGPLMEIARYSGANIVGVNSNEYQLQRARKLTKEAGLSHLSDFLYCDFLHVDAPDESFDGVYGIEATCCAPDKISIYGEAFRLLKPGGSLAVYEYCVTDRFDPENPQHLRIKADLELGGGLLNIDDMKTVNDALETVGFEAIETRDLALQNGPSIPWYQPLIGEGISLASFRGSRLGRFLTHNFIRLLEALRIAPKGSVHVSQNLNLCAAAMIESGKLGIFTPMYFIHARKPL